MKTSLNHKTITVGVGVLLAILILSSTILFSTGSISSGVNKISSDKQRKVGLETKVEVENYFKKNKKMPRIEDTLTDSQKAYFDLITFSDTDNSDLQMLVINKDKCTNDREECRSLDITYETGAFTTSLTINDSVCQIFPDSDEWDCI